jgi:hypothetical protein
MMQRWMILPVVLATVLLATSRGDADQAAWISRTDAEAGAARIHVGTEMRAFCNPCGDDSYVAVMVESVTVAKPPTDLHGPYFEVRVNGQGVDLAYEYVLSEGKWKNVAKLAGLRVVDVPAELPARLPKKL